MKQLFAAILILSIFSFQSSELLVYLAFKINQEYIAENLCVEKDVEDSTCNGCCHLTKKVNEQQEQKKEWPPLQNEKQNINFCSQVYDLKFIPLTNMNLIGVSKPRDYKFTTCFSIFHPPKALF